MKLEKSSRNQKIELLLREYYRCQKEQIDTHKQPSYFYGLVRGRLVGFLSAYGLILKEYDTHYVIVGEVSGRRLYTYPKALLEDMIK